MATVLVYCGRRWRGRPVRRRLGLSLIELLVVLFIISVLLGLLLPAVLAARNRMQAAACQNNVRQLQLALLRCVATRKLFPEPNRWSVDVLKWIEEWPLADAMSGNADPNAEFPRPRLFRCPVQEDFPSRVPTVGFCHYVLIVDRPIRGKAERVRWEIHDRQRLAPDEPQEPWFIAPELSFAEQQQLLTTQPGPHTPGLYMTASGSYPR